MVIKKYCFIFTKFITFIYLVCFSNYIKVYAMGGYFPKFPNDLIGILDNIASNIVEQQKKEMNDLNRVLQDNQASNEEKEIAQKRILLKDQLNNQVNQFVLSSVQQGFSFVMQQQNAEQEAQLKLKEAVATSKVQGDYALKMAEKQGDYALKRAEMYIKALTNRNNAKLAVITLSSLFFTWHGAKLGFKIIDNYLEKIPDIAEDTSLLSYKDRIIKYFYDFNNKVEEKVSDVVLESSLQERINELAVSISRAFENNCEYSNILFYGPPGTGKTMLAKRLAINSGLHYIYFAGSSLRKLRIEDALNKISELFAFAKRSSKKLMIIIDECEVLFRNRAFLSDGVQDQILSLFLALTGTESKNFCIVGLTNRPEDLDAAFLSRCDHQIEIGAPGIQERARILAYYIDKILFSAAKVSKNNNNFFSKFSFFVKKINPLKIEKDLFSKEFIIDIARRLDNFVGRDISKLVIYIKSAAYATKDLTVTKDLVNKVVDIKIKEKRNQMNNFNFDSK